MRSKVSPQRLNALGARAALNADIRAYFAAHGALEVETPILSQAGNTEPNIESFVTSFHGSVHGGSKWRWMRTSPEFPLKRLLAEGVGDVYELGRVFRDGESGGRHNPEFTMLEWYRVGWTLSKLIEECADLIRAVAHNDAIALDVVSFDELYQSHFGIDVDTIGIARLQSIAQQNGIDIAPEGLSKDDWLDLLMTHCLQPAMHADRMLAVHGFPASQAALARVTDGRAERFELYWGSYEVANGYHELTDPLEQGRRFTADLQRRAERGQVAIEMDTRLLTALPEMPDCCGVAMGVDRLLMVMLQTDRIADVLAYDFANS